MKEVYEVSKVKYIGIWTLVTIWVLVGLILVILK